MGHTRGELRRVAALVTARSKRVLFLHRLVPGIGLGSASALSGDTLGKKMNETRKMKMRMIGYLVVHTAFVGLVSSSREWLETL